jgi:hypothetical protein
MLVAIAITLIITIPVSLLWVKGISNMKEKYPNYKGEDFLNTAAGRDAWDDWDNAHTEGEI